MLVQPMMLQDLVIHHHCTCRLQQRDTPTARRPGRDQRKHCFITGPMWNWIPQGGCNLPISPTLHGLSPVQNTHATHLNNLRIYLLVGVMVWKVIDASCFW